MLSGAVASGDVARAGRCANAVCTAEGVLVGMRALLEGACDAAVDAADNDDDFDDFDDFDAFECDAPPRKAPRVALENVSNR